MRYTWLCAVADLLMLQLLLFFAQNSSNVDLLRDAKTVIISFFSHSFQLNNAANALCEIGYRRIPTVADKK